VEKDILRRKWAEEMEVLAILVIIIVAGGDADDLDLEEMEVGDADKI
jgi:hypothetical protein